MAAASQKIVSLQLQSMVAADKLEKLLGYVKKGVQTTHAEMSRTVKLHSFNLLQHRGHLAN